MAMASQSSTLAWQIPWTEEPGGLQSMGSLLCLTSLSCKGNGNPLQCSCLENPRDGGAWWAAVYGVSQSQTRLKRLSSSRQHIKKLHNQSYGFSSSHCRCESWTIKKTEHQRIDAFELWCWRRLLRVPWTATRSNQSILKEISLEYSLGGLMLEPKLQ